jgi:hypothetical protein
MLRDAHLKVVPFRWRATCIPDQATSGRDRAFADHIGVLDRDDQN